MAFLLNLCYVRLPFQLCPGKVFVFWSNPGKVVSSLLLASVVESSVFPWLCERGVKNRFLVMLISVLAFGLLGGNVGKLVVFACFDNVDCLFNFLKRS